MYLSFAGEVSRTKKGKRNILLPSSGQRIYVVDPMLTCEICGEEILLEEDMKSHLLLSHLEKDMHCPLCSLSGVSYDELCFHISSAHPEKQHMEQGPAQITSKTSYAAETNTGTTERQKSQTSQSCSAMDSYDTIGEKTLTSASDITTDSVRPKPMSTRGKECSSAGESAHIRRPTQSTKSRPYSVRLCDQDSDGIESKHNKAKQKRLSSPRKEKLYPCPMCALVCSSCFVLQEHVELHLQEQHSAEGSALEGCSPALKSTSASSLSGEKTFECPLCSVVCSDSFSLQEHVELHLDYNAGSPDSDLKLARQLQEEEEQRKKLEEAHQEREGFKRLQRQFGLDGRGGYCRQMERTMESAVARGLMAPADFHCKRAELMESLASGVDDARTRTQGVTRALYEYYQAECRDCVHVWLSADTDHYCSSPGDKGWGCGYRNFQMLLSSLQRIDMYSSFLQEKSVPSIPQVQRMIEGAWKEGLDPQGASHFNQRLQGTRAWIGATEIYVLLTTLGIRAHMIDFHQPTGPGDTHPQLFERVKQYFCQSSRSGKLPPRVIQTSLPPLYLQHQGHSRSIVGLEQKKNGRLCLLVLDPGSSVSDTKKLLSKDISTAIRNVRKFHCSLKHKQYQVVAVQGVLSAADKEISILNSKKLCAERIP